jgi:NAD(P)-dependent dehydrogenase (short-subunit alcohol dehydrogenase family)
MKGKVVMITGATGGLGEAASRAFAEAGAQVVMLSRDSAKLQASMQRVRAAVSGARVETITADLAEPASVRAAVAQLRERHDRLHVLINNAARFTKTRTVVDGGLEAMFATNHLGPFLLSNLLIDTLRASAPARIFNVTAPHFVEPNFGDLQSEKFSALKTFGASKMCNLLFTYELARRLEGSGIMVNAFFPGFFKSGLMVELGPTIDFLFGLFAGAPDKAAQALVRLAAEGNATGRLFSRKKEIRSNAYSNDPEAQQRLWRASAELTGV